MQIPKKLEEKTVVERRESVKVSMQRKLNIEEKKGKTSRKNLKIIGKRKEAKPEVEEQRMTSSINVRRVPTYREELRTEPFRYPERRSVAFPLPRRSGER